GPAPPDAGAGDQRRDRPAPGRRTARLRTGRARPGDRRPPEHVGDGAQPGDGASRRRPRRTRQPAPVGLGRVRLTAYRVLPGDSEVEIRARSSVHAIHGRATELSGTIDADPVDGRVARSLAVRRVVAAERVRSGNPMLRVEPGVTVRIRLVAVSG